MPKLRLSIVTKLTLLVFAVGLPLSGILAWSIHALFSSDITAAEQYAMSVTNAIAIRAEITVDRTRSVLREIAKRPAVQAMDRSHCDPFLTELRQLMPQYANINTFNLQWEFVCSAVFQASGEIIRSDYPELYERMKAADDMVLSAPVRGQLTRKLVVIAAYPVKDAANNLVGAVSAPIDLPVLAPIIAGATLPANALTRIINGDGYIVTSYPDGDRIGKLAQGVSATAISKKPGTSIELGADGIERIYVHTAVRGTNWVAVAGVPTAWAFADFRRHRNQTLAAMLLVLTLAGSLALIVARRISRPIRELQKDAEVLTQGRLAHRSRAVTQDEVGQLAAAFNTMARALEAHDAERKQAEQELRASERRFSDLLGNVEMVSLMLDTNARITYCNDYLLRLMGWRRDEVIGRDWFEHFIPPAIRDLKGDFFAALLANLPEAWHHENEILTRSGERRLIRWNNSVLRSGAGAVIGTASIGEDITEQKRAEVRIKRLNRVYAILSQINALIVRVQDREELFSEVCRIAVEHGGLRMAWIGVADNEAGIVKPVASAGDVRDFFEAAPMALIENKPGGHGLSGRAVRAMRPIISNDVRNDPQPMMRKELEERGINSLAVMPLTLGGEAIGVLSMYAADVGFFDEEEMRLLQELAGNISFAIDHIAKQERLNYLAYYDVLTGLANRSLFLERVAQHMRSAASGGHQLALFVIDLERFRNINDSLGRPAGDALLKQVAEWLTRNAGDASLLARVGADHFAVVLPEVRQGGDVGRLLEKWIKAFLRHPFRLNDAVFRIASKIGIALFPDDGADVDTLFRNAEAALKKAKVSGERYLFYTQKMTEAVADRLTLENQLRQALDKGEFVLHYQPKVNLASGKLTSAEALIRWNDPRTGLVPPGRIIPILEETGLIHEVGRWALRQAIADYLRWRAAGLPAVRIAVNVSPLQLRNRGFIAEIGQAIAIDAHAAAGLELEITESLIMEDVKHSIASLQAIRAMGVSITIDDFGTGFSSLSYLAKLPVDTLKIDRSFVTDMTTGPEGLALVSTVINLAHSLKLKVVAEGVQTEEQSRLLCLLSCDEMQGYLFGKPVPAEIFEARFLAPPPAG